MKLQSRVYDQIDLDDGGDILVITFARKTKVKRAGLIIDTTDTTAAAVELDRRILTGSDTGRTAALGTITKPASNQQGNLIYDPIDQDFDPCDQLVFQVTTDPGTAVTAIPVIEYYEEEEEVGNLTEVVESA